MSDPVQLPPVEVPEAQEAWVATMWSKSLRERGWTGTVSEYQVASRRLGGDPIARGETSPTDEDRVKAQAWDREDVDLGFVSDRADP